MRAETLRLALIEAVYVEVGEIARRLVQIVVEGACQATLETVPTHVGQLLVYLVLRYHLLLGQNTLVGCVERSTLLSDR